MSVQSLMQNMWKDAELDIEKEFKKDPKEASKTILAVVNQKFESAQEAQKVLQDTRNLLVGRLKQEDLSSNQMSPMMNSRVIKRIDETIEKLLGLVKEQKAEERGNQPEEHRIALELKDLELREAELKKTLDDSRKETSVLEKNLQTKMEGHQRRIDELKAPNQDDRKKGGWREERTGLLMKLGMELAPRVRMLNEQLKKLETSTASELKKIEKRRTEISENLKQLMERMAQKEIDERRARSETSEAQQMEPVKQKKTPAKRLHEAISGGASTSETRPPEKVQKTQRADELRQLKNRRQEEEAHLVALDMPDGRNSMTRQKWEEEVSRTTKNLADLRERIDRLERR